MTAIPFISLNRIGKTFPGVKALDAVSLDLYPGEIHSLVGENGAGKSTLIKIIAGVHIPDSGTIRINGDPVAFENPMEAIGRGISIIYQELNLIQDLTVAENVFLGNMPRNKLGFIDKKKMREDCARLLARVGLDVDPSIKVGYLPVAMQQLCEIAKSLSFEAKLVVMDEPTSALSSAEIESLFKVMDELKRSGVAILYVSHKMDEIFRMSDKVTVLRDGMHIRTGPLREFSKDTLITLMVGRNVNVFYRKQEHSTGKIVLEARGLTTLHIKDASLKVHQGEVVGLSGLMGAGRTELAQAIFGLDRLISGELRIDGKIVDNGDTSRAVRNGIGMVPENRKEQGILPNLNVRFNISMASLDQFRNFLFLKDKDELAEVSRMIEVLNIKTPNSRQNIVNLSGGNQQKVILSRWLLKKDLKILLIDEPTRGIDVGSKEEIYILINELARKGLAIILISSEMPEIMSLCDRVYVMKDGRLCNEFVANEFSPEVLLSCSL